MAFGQASNSACIGGVVHGTLVFPVPMPPSHLSIATASPDGAYYLHAQRYAELFSDHGVNLDIQTSAGSQQNLELLRSADRLTDLAFVQGGLAILARLRRHKTVAASKPFPM